jgi:Anti-sigma-K factor rskA, C-terminal/Putative zinc-finger
VTEDRHGELMGPYLLGELTAEEQRELELHLEECAGCRSELESIRHTHELLRKEAATMPPPELKDRVLAQATGEVSEHYRSYRRRWRLLVPAAAALLVIAFLGVGLLWATRSDSSVNLPLTATTLAPGASGVVREEAAGANIRIKLEVQGLPELREDEYYEMWYYTEEEDGGERISCGSFRPAPDGPTTVYLTTPVNARDYPEIEVTREADDGDPESSGERVLEGELRDA